MLEEFHVAYDALLARWPVAVEETTFDAEHARIRMNVCGPPDAPPVVLLAGAGASSTVWFANVGALSKTRRVIAVDMPGDAGYSVVHRRLSVAELVDCLDDAVLSVVGERAVSLVGHSYGAQVALTYALRRPDRVAGLVLLDPNGCFAGTSAGYLLRAVPVLVRPTGRRITRLIDWESAQVGAVDAGWLRVARAASTLFPVRGLTIPPRPSDVEVGALTMSVTVAFAAQSRVHDAPRVAERLRRAHPGFTVVLIDAASHHSLPAVPSTGVDAVIAQALNR
ncbi:alpha/beta fold hydrolase [Gordonia sp. TBRC 11910]|uniref:Alpha/beta fold hydrolase n=1 Tax=Gordonia asplenii TaxID=2725283 RepID=A0A848L6K9_9ACTN|nr:alpha/beta fold hydrolase [Gordonia asplenii]NMO04323.1 alpha/beta fold hydrolase [Gordonia asplenii]